MTFFQRKGTLADLGLLLAGSLVFLAPGYLGGRVLAPAGDGQSYYYPVRVHAAQLAVSGQWPIWSRNLYGGFPLLADIEVGVLYPPNWLFLVLPGRLP